MQRFLILALISMTLLSTIAHAEEMPRPDDRVIFDVSAEDWVMTKTVHVTITVDAAVSDKNSGTMRGDMVKAVNDLAKGDWRLTSFNRSSDKTGLENWSVTFESRLPEALLNGLSDNTKKFSKPGMQLSIGDIDFTPSLEEMEAARGTLRTQIYKTANEQLTALNTAMPGRNYRIAMVNFATNTDEPGPVPMPRVVRGQANMMMMATAAPAAAPAPAPMERSEKITMNARVVFAALPDSKPTAQPHP
jgi:predicted secreted protein